MNSEQLKTFLSIAECGNFSRTAEALFISQSSVSKRIYELEKEIGQTLFVRKKSGVRLTTAGKTLQGYAEQIINTEEKALEQIRRNNQYSEYLIIGATYAYYDMYLSKQLSVFAEHNPNISISIKLGHTGRLFNELMKASINIVFSHRPLKYPEYICKNIGDDDIILITDINNIEFENGISYENIKILPMIETNFLYATTRQDLFPQSHRAQLEVDIAASAIPLLKGNKWYALLARRQVEKKLLLGKLREIPILDGNIPPVQHFIVYQRGSEQQEGVRSLLSQLYLGDRA